MMYGMNDVWYGIRVLGFLGFLGVLGVLGERGATIRNMDANTVTSRVTPVRIMNE